MAKGALSKQEIGEKILKTFEGAFYYNSGKEIRIPWNEGGTDVQIKISMVCAKDNVNPTGEVLEMKESAPVNQEMGSFMNFPEPHKKVEPTEEEKQNVEDLLKALGLD